MDTDTVISDITDNNSVDSQKQDELRAKTELNLNNLTNDPLKDKCKELYEICRELEVENTTLK